MLDSSRQAGEVEITQAVLRGIEEFKDSYGRRDLDLFQDERLWLAECVSRHVLDCLQSPAAARITESCLSNIFSDEGMSGQKHKASKSHETARAVVASSFLFDGKSAEALKHSLKGFRDRGFDGNLVNCRLDVSKPVQRCPTRLASDDVIVGWAVNIDDNGRSTLTAFDGDFRVVARGFAK